MNAVIGTPDLSVPSPATVEVVRNAFISGAEQMRRNLYRSAHSPVIYEMKDCSVGIFDAQGRLLGQAPGLPFFLGSLGGTLRAVIRIKGYEAFREGDVWIVNDSSIAGSHLNDVTVFAPVFVEGALRGFSAAKAHWSDIGAKRAGYVGDTVDIFQEGLRIGPTCIFRAGRLDQQIVDLIALNSRFPTALVGDLMAEISACRTGVERFRSIVRRFGWDQVETSVQLVFDQAEVEDRASVEKIPDGVYVADGYLDNDGVTEDPVYVKVTITVEGDSMTVDLSGSNKQCVGSINSGVVQTRSAIEQGFKFLVNPRAPVSGGNFRNLRVIAPEGTCFNPSETAPLPPLRAPSDAGPRSNDQGSERGDSRAGRCRSCRGLVECQHCWSQRVRSVPVRGIADRWLGRLRGRGRRVRPDPLGRRRLQELSDRDDGKPVSVCIAASRPARRVGRRRQVARWSGNHQGVRTPGALHRQSMVREVDAAVVGPLRWRGRRAARSVGPLPRAASTRMLKANNLKVEAGTRLLVKTGGGGGWGDPAERASKDRARDRRLEMVI